MALSRKRRPATSEEAAALSSDLRLRIIRLTFERPLTNKELAQRLDKDPATTLHHVRKLVAAGFLEAMPPRAGNRGAKEIPYRSTGLSWQLDNSENALAVGEAMLHAFLGEVADIGLEDVDQSRLVVTVDPEELKQRLATLMDELAAQPVKPDVPRVAIYLAVYPGD
ncbi:helix-turn-helix domain-containing protein [Lentzea sp. DG1S-22]|uniref:ArsR/SmtB family transcription factor n=1 Tax=Lentzea sp. DG1S-22 TaxID=3108822 RepID=UPI002E786037|nr:helix-turn-helix domain-containing protein [Lentzea sp. DG1S-22]WVH84595.1 helix-turn-helix domain-containing protein [Lentzea sp. DG1S-22]